MNPSNNVLERNVVKFLALMAFTLFVFFVALVTVGNDILRASAERNNIAVARNLIALGLDVNAKEPETGYTPLMLAAKAGNGEMVAFYLKHGARVNDADAYHGQTALFFAEGNQKIVHLLLNAGADPNVRTKAHGDTALIFASGAGNEEVVRLLIDYKADKTVVNKGGANALLAAKLNKHPNIVRILEQN